MFKYLLSSIAFVASAALAQSVDIGLPEAGAILSPGLTYTFQVQCPDSLTSVQQVALVIGIQQCENGACFPPDESMGTVLYSGSYDPQFHDAGPPYQNFSVTMPEATSWTPALVTVAHFALVGDGFAPLIDYHNRSVTLV